MRQKVEQSFAEKRWDRVITLFKSRKAEEVANLLAELQRVLIGTNVTVADLGGCIEMAQQGALLSEAPPPSRPVSWEEAIAAIKAFIDSIPDEPAPPPPPPPRPKPTSVEDPFAPIQRFIDSLDEE
jgi:hypothetical protein